MKLKHLFFLLVITCGVIIAPRVNAKSFNVVAGAGRSAVMNPSGTYYYTQWKGLSSDSLNILPIPYPNGDYYLMGSEYSFAITLTGETSFRGHVTIPVAANTIYNYTMTNGLLQADGSADLHFGIDQNFGIYNMGLGSYNATWSCNTYTNNLGVAHNLCFYDIEFSFSTDTNYEGAYNLNVAVLNTTGNRSAFYYSGIDSNGNGIEFPVNASGSQYSTVRPYLSMTGLSGDSSSPDNTEEILNGVSQASAEISQTIQESYENLVMSQEVCTRYDFSSNVVAGYILNDGTIGGINGNWRSTDYIPISKTSLIWIRNFPQSTSTSACFYNSNKSKISCFDITAQTLNTPISIPTNATYFRSTIGTSNNNSVIFDICRNGNQAINDTILDDSHESPNQFLQDMESLALSDTPITDLLAMPLNMVRAFHSGISGQCSTIDLGSWYDKPLYIPCLDIPSYIGNTLWNIIDVLFSGFLIYNIAELMIHDFDSFSSAEDLFDETYTPKHTYKPKHGKE